jgi:hypothetical protein
VYASSPNNQKFVKQLIERGTKILQVPNHVDPLKASEGERSVHNSGFVLLRLLAPKAGNHCDDPFFFFFLKHTNESS